MEFDGIQMTLIALFLVSAVAVAVVCNFLRETFLRQRLAVLPYAEPEPAWEFAKRTAVPVAAEVVVSEPAPDSPAPIIASQPQVASTPSPLPERAVDAYLWEDVGQAKPAQPVFELIQGGNRSGMIDQAAFQQVAAECAAFTGVVVSISVNDADGSMWHSPGLMRSVSKDIAGLLGEHDLGCRTAFDEFLIVCPEEQNAPRRLREITQGLWDCQLRGCIRFTWGSVHVDQQSLAEALASAADRMRESKRISDWIFAGSNEPRRRAV